MQISGKHLLISQDKQNNYSNFQQNLFRQDVIKNKETSKTKHTQKHKHFSVNLASLKQQRDGGCYTGQRFAVKQRRFINKLDSGVKTNISASRKAVFAYNYCN